MTNNLTDQQRPPCLMNLSRGGLCLAPSIQIHSTLGPLCALHLYHQRRNLNARPNLQVRVDASDLEALDTLAQSHNLTRSDAMRRLLRHLPFPRPKVDADTYFELRRIGVNLNRIAHKLNCGNEVGPEYIQPHLLCLEARLDSLSLRLCQASTGGGGE